LPGTLSVLNAKRHRHRRATVAVFSMSAVGVFHGKEHEYARQAKKDWAKMKNDVPIYLKG
jgi:hypothetical protein